jgi:hypothetical protein
MFLVMMRLRSLYTSPQLEHYGRIMDENAQNQYPVLSGGGANRNGETIDPVTGQVLCGNLDMRIDRDGVWFYHGTPIGRKALVKLFASILQRDEDGRYWLETPAEKGEIIVEDAAFMAVALDTDGSGEAQTLKFRTNTDEIVIADGDHPLRIQIEPDTQEPSPYVLVRGGLEARLTRPVFYELVNLGVQLALDGGQIYGVWSAGHFFHIGPMPEDAPEEQSIVMSQPC